MYLVNNFMDTGDATRVLILFSHGSTYLYITQRNDKIAACDSHKNVQNISFGNGLTTMDFRINGLTAMFVNKKYLNSGAI